MTTELLDELLHAELRREPTDGQAVRMILQTLKEREDTRPLEISPEIEEAWDKYQVHTGGRQGRPARMRGWILKAVSAAAIVLLLLATIPQQVKADNFFGRLVSWTNATFKLLNPLEDKDNNEYVFETNHPGLQEVYDTLTELGVTGPVVPRWLPALVELDEIKVNETPAKTKLYASFIGEKQEIGLKVTSYSENITVEYQKDQTVVELIEMDGTTHSIIRNNDEWVAVWIRDNIECSISTDCQKDTLVKILRSIYMMEEG